MLNDLRGFWSGLHDDLKEFASKTKIILGMYEMTQSVLPSADSG